MLDATTVVPTTTPTPRVSFSSAPKASIEDRLRGHPGIFEGVRLPPSPLVWTSIAGIPERVQLVRPHRSSESRDPAACQPESRRCRHRRTARVQEARLAGRAPRLRGRLGLGHRTPLIGIRGDGPPLGPDRFFKKHWSGIPTVRKLQPAPRTRRNLQLDALSVPASDRLVPQALRSCLGPPQQQRHRRSTTRFRN
jgi:hypothetical protein